MKKTLVLSFFLIFALSQNIYSQMRVVNPSVEYLGSTDNVKTWEENCNSWKRTIRGITGQLPTSTDRIAVQYLIEYVAAYSMINDMRIEIYDVWAIQYPNYIVFVWFTNYENESWTFKSMNMLKY
jgi:hypothetical protein